MKEPISKLLSTKNLGDEEFPIKQTLVTQNVWCSESEDLTKVAETILYKALKFNMNDVHIVRVLHKSGWEKGVVVLVKIERQSAEELAMVLKAKSELRKSEL